MKQLVLALLAVVLVGLPSVAAAQTAQPLPPPPQPTANTTVQDATPAPKPTSCLAVIEAGSHAFRNIMLGGLAGAIVSKKQYKVVNAVNYPAHIGQKFHGGDLQMFSSSGTKVIILDKKYSPEDLQTACPSK